MLQLNLALMLKAELGGSVCVCLRTYVLRRPLCV